MMVSSIESMGKQKYIVRLDSGLSFPLYKGEIRILKLTVGKEVSETEYNSIMNVILPRRCKLRAMKLLEKRAYTEYMLKTKLLEGGYPVQTAELAMDYVKSFGYINDYKYCLEFIESRINRCSVKEIRQKLLQKGIDIRCVDNALHETEAEDCESENDKESGLIRNLLVKRKYTKEMDYEEKQKLLQYFYRRGFDIDKVRKIMDE